MSYDLLTDPINTVFAVNCTLENGLLHCGALYLDPLIQSDTIRLSHEGDMIRVKLPPEALNLSDPFRAWEVDLPVLSDD